MISFLLCLALLIIGYFVYGKIVDNTFGPDDRETPAVRINDGVDYVVMPQWKLFLVQLLNIAGLGPIFGALQGALWGPVVFLWITFGTIFAAVSYTHLDVYKRQSLVCTSARRAQTPKQGRWKHDRTQAPETDQLAQL